MDTVVDSKNSPGQTVPLLPLQIGEVVLKTADVDRMRDFYAAILNLKPSHDYTPPPGHKHDEKLGPYVRASDMRSVFFTLTTSHPYRQTLGIFGIPELTGDPRFVPGMHHLNFRNGGLAELIERYEQLKGKGVVPFRTANHGTSTSFYYRDPDNNTCELSAPNYENEKDTNAFRNSEAFHKNPSGIEIDVEEFIGRFRAGVPQAELVKF